MASTADFVVETSSTTGTGTYSLNGAVSGLRTLVAGLVAGPGKELIARTATYSKWERFSGTLTDAATDTLTRTLIESSTGSLIDWQAGDLPIYIHTIASATRLNEIKVHHRGSSAPTGPLEAGMVWIDATGGASALVWKSYTAAAAWIALWTQNESTGAISYSAAINEAKGADIASATTTDIGAATGNYVEVTGTVTITGLGTIQAGTRRIVRFTGALLLTHNATSLILPGGANITTVAGDLATFISLGSGNWRCIDYQRPASPLGWQVLESASVSAAASYIKDSIPSWVNFLRITGDLFPVTDGVAMNFLARKASGTDIAVYDYQYLLGSSATPTAGTAASQAVMALYSTTQNDANVGGVGFSIEILNIQSSRHKRALVRVFSRDSAGVYSRFEFGFHIADTAVLTGIKLLFSSGNINDGRVLIEGCA